MDHAWLLIAGLITLIARPALAQSATIVGVVRAVDLDTPLPGARVDVTELGVSATSDTTGAYQLPGLPAGTVTVRVTHPGYDTLSLEVTVPDQGQLQVDLALSRTLVVLDSVRVTARRPLGTLRPTGPQPDDGAWTWRGNPAASPASTGEPDMMRTLTADPHLALRPDWPGSLMDRGGTPDQLMVRVDGFPLWSPVHGSGTLSVISPDVIGSIAVRDGAFPAPFGDRLGGVVDVHTTATPDANWAALASLGSTATRAMYAAPIAVGDATGGLQIAVRRSNDEIVANDAGPLPDHWTDGVASTSITSGPSTVRVLLLASTDRAAPLGTTEDAASSGTIPWNTGTLGLAWTQHLGRDLQLDTHLSTAWFTTTVPSAADSADQILSNALHETMLTTQLSTRALTVGVSLDAPNVSYHVANTTTNLDPQDNASHAPSLALGGAPTILAAFAERRWGPTDSSWHVTTGLRAMTLVGLGARLEPRIEAAVRLMPGVVATAGYARTHQAVQSLRNPESPFGAEIGIDLPVVAGVGGVPLAQSDVGTVGIATTLGPVGRLSVDGYVRSLSGLAIANPLESSLFATTTYARASARVAGFAAQLTGARGRFVWQAGYGFGRTTESTAGMAYQPTSDLGQTGSAALGIALDRLTTVRLAGWAAFGQRAPGLDGASVDADGDSDAEGAVTWPRLPPYLRADIQLAHQWWTGPVGGRLSAYVTLANVFNHANIAGQAPDPVSGALRPLTLLPRSLLVGVTWTR